MPRSPNYTPSTNNCCTRDAIFTNRVKMGCRYSLWTRALAIAVCCTLWSFPFTASAAIIDSINGSAAPASNSLQTITWSFYGQGWYYTPAFNYTLTGISSNYGQTNTPLATPQIIVQVQTDRPVNGGQLLTQGTFQGNSAQAGIQGTTVNPIDLIAGHTYFVDFLNDQGMGVNIGLWQSVGGVPTPSNGATVNLGALYYDPTSSTGFTDVLANGANETFFGTSSPVVNASGGEPILFFSGTVAVPEPSSITLLATGGLAMVWYIRRRRTC